MNDTPNPNPSPPDNFEALLELLDNDDQRSLVRDFVQPLLDKAAAHDEQLRDAETTGYLRGKNEKIELVTRPAEEMPEEPAATITPFPRYAKRSVWSI